MKTLIIASALLISGLAGASTVMGPEAKEMFAVLTHPQVKDCLANVDTKMINLEIKKTVYRCPGCNTYVISGNELAIDVPSADKTVITIKGRSVPGTFGGWIQTYSCEVKAK